MVAKNMYDFWIANILFSRVYLLRWYSQFPEPSHFSPAPSEKRMTLHLGYTSFHYRKSLYYCNWIYLSIKQSPDQFRWGKPLSHRCLSKIRSDIQIQYTVYNTVRPDCLNGAVTTTVTTRGLKLNLPGGRSRQSLGEAGPHQVFHKKKLC